jgi:glycerate-2-kinase
MHVKNLRQLCRESEHSVSRHLREVALQAYDFALCCVDPARLVRSALTLHDNILEIGGSNIDITATRVFVVGCGKASGTMAVALEDLLGDKLVCGCVNVPPETICNTRLVRLNRAGHPVPDKNGVDGARRIIELADIACADDLVICLISGGGSSLMPLPKAGISLADKQKITTRLLKSGASIGEINVVRKHLSDIKGGLLARRIYSARLFNLILSDVVGDKLDIIASGPTVPDTSTFADAVAILQSYEIWQTMPEAVGNLLIKGLRGSIEETPKPDDLIFKRVSSHVLGNNRLALVAASKSLSAAGFSVEIVEPAWQGDALELGRNLAERALAVAHAVTPTAVVMGGEATVKVTGNGLGGRNQHAALAVVKELAGNDKVLVAVLATDGIDGPTDACGALVDGDTLARAQKLDMTPETFLQNNDSYGFFNALGDLVHTGYTGSNVNDIYIILSAGSSAI